MKLNLKFSSGRKGFTLIELVISIAVSSVILAVAGSLFSGTLNAMNLNNKKIQNMNESYLFFEMIRAEVEEADLVVENTNNFSLGFGVVKHISGRENRYTYYSLENGAIYRNTQKSSRDYTDVTYLRGKKGKNKIIDKVQTVSTSFNKGSIEVRANFDGFSRERIYAVRFLNE